MRALACLRIAVLGPLLALLATPAGAATRDFYIQTIGTERGLTQSAVGAIVQDGLGFVWVGTQGGLHRYDGERYRVFRHDPRDPGSLPDSFVTALAVDDAALWVGTYSQYIARLDLRSGSIRRYAGSTPDRRADRQVLALLADRGAVWVATVAGLDRLEVATGRRTRVVDLRARPDVGASGQALLRDRRGRVWYATSDGVFRVDGIRARRVGGGVAAGSLLEDRDGRLWIGSARGLERVEGDARVPVWSPPATRPVDVRALVQARDGRLWLSAYPDGVRGYDPATGSVVTLRTDRELPGTLPENSVNTMFVDRGGMLWLGGQYRGAAVMDPRGARFVFATFTGLTRSANPAADDSIRAVVGTPGVLWLGTDGDSLLRYDLQARAFEDVTDRLPASQGRIAGFLPTDAGHLLLATGNGLVDFDPATRRSRPVPIAPGPQPALRAMARDANGGLWLGTSGDGAYHVPPAPGRVRHFVPGAPGGWRISHRNVHAVMVDRRGRAWLGTGDGLDVFDPARGTTRHFRYAPDRPDTLPSNVVRALLQDARGRVWVGTHAGVVRAVPTGDGNDFAFRRPRGARSLGQSLVVFSLQESPAGVLWAGTDGGLLRYRADTGDARLYGLGDGLQDLEFNGGAAARLPDGRLAFGGVRGVNIFDPRRVDDREATASVRLLSARFGNRAEGAVLWQPAVLRVPAGEDLLRLQVGTLDFAPAARPRYRYRLEGFDADWIYNGDQRDIAYTHLPPGRYTFRAQATDAAGRWSPRELRLPVQVEMPWWRQPVVLVLAALLLMSPFAIAAWQWVQRRRHDRAHLVSLREREQRLKLALWASGEQFWTYALHDRAMHCTRAGDVDDGAEIAMTERAESGHRVHPEDRDRVQQQLLRHLRGEQPVFESEHRIDDGHGDWTWIRARGRVVERDASGRAVRIAGTARDVSATRRAERERRVASEVLRSMAEAVCVFDDDFHFISVNPAFTRMTGYAESEVIGETTSLIDSRQHDADVYRLMRNELRRDGRWAGELWQRRKDGSEFLCWLQASVVHDSVGQRGHWVAVLSDITDQKRAEQELRYLANYDTLTGLPNRALLTERLQRAISRARRHDTRIAVLFLDLDRFKDINDSLGHAAGDAILRATAGRLQHVVGGVHTVARLGGDEFTVVMEHVEDIADAEGLARQLLTAFELPLDAGDLQDIVISPSIGIALYPDHADTPSDLLKHADTAMYQAKAIGRRTYMQYTGSMDIEIRRRATLSAALRKVIDRDELSLVYQPRLSLHEQRIVGVEALLRWNSAEFGAVSPAQFIPLAEETGLILEIGDWALREACRQLRQWLDVGIDVSMAVNVSALQLRRGDLAATIERQLADAGLPPERLEIELTESVVMAEETWSALHAIRSLGVHMSIDDFGTGYSSFAYLKRLPIHALKIDREFIGDLTRDPDDEAITSAVIAMGHSLGLRVVAEGVETEHQLDFLRRHGCDEIQGYWLARPLDPATCQRFLRDWASGARPTGLVTAP